MCPIAESLIQTLRHAYGDLLDFPCLAPPAVGPSTLGDPAQELARYGEKIRYCKSCSLHIGRRNLVFGRGHWDARLAFVGDFPSATDDQEGEPFSDQSGELLHKMILAMRVKPEETYWTNLLKCRPPAGMSPDSSHALACEEHLLAQLAHVRAPILVAMGEHTARALARSEAPLRVLRKQVFEWHRRKVICTHHPRELLSAPEKKKEAWEDLQAVMREMENLS